MNDPTADSTDNKEPPSESIGPLSGLTVVEVGQLLAGPFAGTLLAYFGAEVIKIEPPGKGDPIRQWRTLKEGTSLWWRSLGRNKKSITLDLNQERGCTIAKQLINKADVLIENFRPGKMEQWGLGPEIFKQSNPELIYARISGYGQDGPYANKPGFASVTEGISGFRYINGYPDEVPVRPNISLGDSLAGLHAAFGITLALLARTNGSPGQVVDVALYESIFNLMEAIVPEYCDAGIIREPSGTTVTGIVPTNTYRCRDGKFVVIGGNGDSIYKRLMHAAGYPELAEDPRLADNPGRVEHQAKIDAALQTWTKNHDSSEVLTILEKALVPSGPIYNVEDMVSDPHFNARGLFEEVSVNNKSVTIPAITPRLCGTPGKTDWAGPEIGSSNQEIFHDRLELSEGEITQLKADRII